MARNSVLLLLLAQLIILGNGQMYDMSDGNNEEIVCPCNRNRGTVGHCTFEYANRFSGGPTNGFVYSTDSASTTCIDVFEPITLTENSKFYMHMHVPYNHSWEIMQVALMNETEGRWVEWTQISGPIPENERWIEISVPLPSSINPGTYKIAIWDYAGKNKISIRSFAIIDEGACAADNF